MEKQRKTLYSHVMSKLLRLRSNQDQEEIENAIQELKSKVEAKQN